MALDQPTSMLYLIQKMTKIESRTHQYWKLQASETKIVRRKMHISSPIRYVANSSWSKANLVAYTLTVQRWNLHYSAHQLWSHQTSWRPHRHGSGSNTTNLVHPRTPMVEFLPDSCKKKQCWSFDINAILLSKLAIMARPTMPMRCPM